MSKVRRFSDEELIGLLHALRARNESHPDSPWLIAYWPRILEEEMADACGELISRGHAITSVPWPGRRRGAARSAWAVADDAGSVHGARRVQ